MNQLPPLPAVPVVVPAGVPAAPPTRVFYSDFFNDPANDTYQGNYAGVLDAYSTIGVNPVVGATALRNIVANARNQGVPTAFLLQHAWDQNLHVYLQLNHFDARMGLSPTACNDNFYASKGELHFNRQQTIHFDNNHFTQTAQLVILPTATTIDTALVADSALVGLVGPFTPAIMLIPKCCESGIRVSYQPSR